MMCYHPKKNTRRDKDLDKISQLLMGSASDYFIAETNYFVFNYVFYGEPSQLLEKGFGTLCSTMQSY